MNNDIQQAVQVLNQGGIIIFPTDTAFGIGCRIDNEQAVQKLFKIRKRPESQATPVLVSSVEMAQDYLRSIPQEVIDKLINKYWPGALTIVLACKTVKVPTLVRGGTNTLGVRMPNHQDTLELIKNTGVPFLGPSANFHGEKTPYEFTDLNKDLLKHVDFVIKGECTLKRHSTVIDCSITPWKVLRNGATNL